MKKPRAAVPFLRGLTLQLFVVTVHPLTLLLLVIAFGSYTLHQRDMRALVGQRDERAVQSATAALEAELHHRTAAISSLAALASAPGNASRERMLSASSDLTADFDGGRAFVGTDGRLLANTQEDGPWFQIVQKAQGIQFASALEPGPVIPNPFTDPGSKRISVIISVYSPP